jgi:NAD+ synthase (glutamine-hydrolysing)
MQVEAISKSQMQVAIAQINCVVGDLAGNAARILSYAHEAKAAGASLMLTPELALSGYSPQDLLLREDFTHHCQRELQALAKALPADITVVVGHPHREHGRCYNAASVLQGGRIVLTYHKHALPNHSVFDEVRYFSPGNKAGVFEHQGVRCGILICADVWEPGPAKASKQAGAELLLVLNASPFHLEKQQQRYKVLGKRVEETSLPLVYANLVGGQDELVFDGNSVVIDRCGAPVQQLPAFTEQLALVSIDLSPQNRANPLPAEIAPGLTREESAYQALTLCLRDYVQKNGFPGAVLGLSGGIDSALTLAIAVDALGADKVHAVMMPSEFTADMSVDDARQMAQLLGVKYTELPIKPLFDQFCETLAEPFAGTSFDLTEENLQARIRGMLLMALSNKFGSIVLTTGNKSEMAVGYSTLYGDMAGGFAVLKDISKTLVYRLARYRNSLSQVIPERIIIRPPSAELRHGQTDQDSLPPYDVLDAIMEAYVERDSSRQEIVAMGYREQDVARVLTLIDRNEYKRRQSPIGVRVTERGFGLDRRYPVVSRFVSKD